MLYAACFEIILLNVFGCVHYSEKWPFETHFKRAGKHILLGNFQAALYENDKVFRQSFPPPRAQAVLQRGLIYAHPQNPARDYGISMDYFQKILRDYPDSNETGSALVLMLTIEELTNMDKKRVALEKKVDDMERIIKKQRRTVNRIKDETKKKQAQISVLNFRLQQLENQIEELKKIDIRIEKEKRKSISN